MKNLKEATLTELEKDQVEAITKIANEAFDNARNLNLQLTEGEKVDYIWANITFRVTQGPGGGNCIGYIHYHDGRNLKFYGEATLRKGLPIAQGTAPRMPAMVLPYDFLLNAEGNYYASGYSPAGAMTLTSRGKQVNTIPWPLGGFGFRSWTTHGKGKFEKA